MQYRKATLTDTPAIIELLKASPEEHLMSKSEELWKWKHIANPFGESPMILAESDGKIIAVRAFLRWEFLQNEKIVKACRAVDTAVHPDYQGKGLFTGLTLQLIEEIKLLGIDFIYNTPNVQSMPGYEKMGWTKWGKLPLKLVFNLSLSKNTEEPKLADWESISELVSQIESLKNIGSGQTNLVKGYLDWRYRLCPLISYSFLTDEKSFLMIYRIKEGKMGRELRIDDLFVLREFGSSEQKELHTMLSKAQKQHSVNYTSFSGLAYNAQSNLNLGILPILAIGPMVTFRTVNPEVDPHSYDWKWSLGDLEVF